MDRGGQLAARADGDDADVLEVLVAELQQRLEVHLLLEEDARVLVEPDLLEQRHRRRRRARVEAAHLVRVRVRVRVS